MGILYDEQSTKFESHDKLLRQSQANFLMHCPHFLTDICEIPYRNFHTTQSSICAFGANRQSECKIAMMGLTVCRCAVNLPILCEKNDVLVQTVLRHGVWAERRTAGRLETTRLCRFSDGERSVVRWGTGAADSTGQLVWLQAAGSLVLWKSYFRRGVMLCYVLT